MLVSQYIYTACGKERTGAFSIFSKSRDITAEESAEIREVMMYKTPSGLPYEPTEQEIENLFPKKYGYFFLSSGRVCLAQACYVGRVYSELDGRFGNYIIHAFVFKKACDFSPYSFIEHALFKRMLTRKEWHDDPIPDELPQIEIPESGGTLSVNEVTFFLNEDRKEKLKLLIEAIINSSGENPVLFYDEPKNQKYWLKLLSLCLPKIMQNSIGFCTHFTNTLIPGNISSRIQIRINQPESPQFNYTQEAQRGRYVLDFSQSIVSESLKPGKYAERIVKLLSSGIFEAVKLVDNINRIMSNYSVSIGEALDLMLINSADYSDFRNADEIYNAILTSDRIGYETQSIANNFWINKPRFNFNVQQNLWIYDFIYKNSSVTDTRIKIIKTIIDNAEQFGVRTYNAAVFNDELNSKAKFIFTNYLDYLKEGGLINYVKLNQNSFAKLFIAFDFLTNLPMVKNSFQTRNNKTLEEKTAVINIMVSAFNRKSISDLDLLIDSANSNIDNFGTELLSVLVQSVINSNINITSVQFAFDILQRLHPKTDFACSYLLYLIKTMSGQNGFTEAYINAQDNNPDFYTLFENKYKHESLMLDFCRIKDVYRFANQPLTLKVLKEYFDKYYAVGDDQGIFIKRLNEYVYSIQPEKRINECISILDTMKLPPDADRELLSPVHYIVLEAIFSLPYDKIHNFYGKQEGFDRINELYDTVANKEDSVKQEIRELIMVMRCGRILEKYDFRKNIDALSFFGKTQTDDVDNLASNFGIIDSEKSINTFIDYYFQPVANILFLGATDSGNFDYDGVLERVFGKIIVKGNLEKLTDNIFSRAKKSKANPIAFLLHIFRKHFMDSPNPFEKKLGDIAENYFKKVSSGERKRIFSELLSLAEPTEAIQFKRYFEEFNKTNKGGLFDFFKKK